MSDERLRLEVDHLVVGAATLDAGAAWCRATLGVEPAGGGRHALMGTHNRVLSIASADFPQAYLEIIAIDPQAPEPKRARWFGLDEPALRAALAGAPRLIGWVARCRAIDRVVVTLRAAGFDPGEIVAAERRTPTGLLSWKIAVPAGGHRPGAGALPLVIEWSGAHPCDDLPSNGVALEALVADAAAAPIATLVGAGLRVAPAPSTPLGAVLATPLGRVTLESA